LKIARQLVEQNQDRLVAENSNPLIDAWRFRPVTPERGHDVATPKLVGDEAPEKRLRVLVAVENDNFGRTELGSTRRFRHDLPTQGGVRSEQPERNQAVRLTTAHGLRQIERAISALAGQSLEAAPDQEIEALGEVIAPEERAAVDLEGGEILNLRYLFDEAVAAHDLAGATQLFHSADWHFSTWLFFNGLTEAGSGSRIRRDV
jgi:hypothetical protein